MRKILIASSTLGSKTKGNFETCFQESLFEGFKGRVGNVLEIEVDNQTLDNLAYARNWEKLIGMIINRYLEIKIEVSSKVGDILDINNVAKEIINKNAVVTRDIMPKAA